MQDPMYPAGVSDNNPYFDDDSEPLLSDGPYEPTTTDEVWEVHFGSSRTDALLHGSPWPNSAIEAASFEYEICHW